ncbi:hypothetical protein ACA910_014483 [Epithemia clementina (nom. ined.)]
MEDDTFSIADSSITSVSLNPAFSEDDGEGIALLRQIFVDEPIDELRKIHRQRLESASHRQNTSEQSPIPKPGLSTRDPPGKARNKMNIPRVDLPDDFLRLPSTVAVLRYRGDHESKDGISNAIYRYDSLKVLEEKVLRQIKAKSYRKDSRSGTTTSSLCDRLLLDRQESTVLTKAVFRDPHIGMGMTLSYEKHVVKVHSVAASSGNARSTHSSSVGPSMKAGIFPGDILLGFNGKLLTGYKSRHIQGEDDMLLHVVETIRNSPDPIVVHLCRAQVNINKEPTQTSNYYRGNSLLDETLLDSSNDEIDTQLESDIVRHDRVGLWSTPSVGQNGEPQIHRLIQILSSRGLVPSSDEEMELSADIARFNERAWEMESFTSLRLTHRRSGNMNDTLIPLVGVRKALSVRIVHSFLEGTRTAYTVWVYDVESGKEWYAPLRYFEDFADLRHAVMNLIPRFGKLPFPRQATSIFGSPRRSSSPTSLEARCWQLEKFLRSLCSLLYESQLDASTGEVAVHVQSFLGCESMDFQPPKGGRHQSQNEMARSNIQSMKNTLKRSFQYYTYRIFLLKPLAYIVGDFVESMRQKCPSLQDLESIESQGVTTLQKLAMKDLATLEKFLDFLQATILEGCMDDFRSITMHETFFPLTQSGCFHGKKGEIAWNALVRDAVREQVEVEAYVPLRSVVSRWLVNGWRHEDMEVHFKINELRKRPASYFSNVPTVKSGPETWLSVSVILKESVERSTLPCAKLRAIVEAAREIARICANENETRRNSKSSGGRGSHKQAEDEESLKQLGADQFLPILIYCVVMATIERPCALCVLLRSLCDKVHRIGEVGYYLASFEASVVHVRDFDLSERSEQMRSFVSVNLDAD